MFERYDNVPASLADACLVRLAELHEPSRVLTMDGDFRIYRRHGRKAIGVISPPDRA
jgi:predicted nucleic acid-binding protein